MQIMIREYIIWRCVNLLRLNLSDMLISACNLDVAASIYVWQLSMEVLITYDAVGLYVNTRGSQ